MLMTQFSISALNDWADRELDLAAGRHRPVARGRIPARVALGLAILFALAAIPGALSFGFLSLTIVVLGIGIGWTYDLILKPTPWSFLPFAVAFPLLPFWLGIVVGRPPSSLLPLFFVGAPLAVAIHLADAIPDRESDREAGVQTLAVVLGRPAAEVTAAASFLAGVAIALVTFWHAYGARTPLIMTALNAVVLVSIAFNYASLSLRRSSPVSLKFRQSFAKWVLILATIVVGLFATVLLAHG